jgi:hypothetical protein
VQEQLWVERDRVRARARAEEEDRRREAPSKSGYASSSWMLRERGSRTRSVHSRRGRGSSMRRSSRPRWLCASPCARTARCTARPPALPSQFEVVLNLEAVRAIDYWFPSSILDKGDGDGPLNGCAHLHRRTSLPQHMQFNTISTNTTCERGRKNYPGIHTTGVRPVP